MKLLSTFLIGVCMLSHVYTALAEESSTCPPAPTEQTEERIKLVSQQARDRGFLWRITKGDHTSYLYGTIHVGKLEWMFPGDHIKQAIALSNTIALEMDMLDSDVQKQIVAALKNARKTPLPASLQAKLKQRMQADCIPYDVVSHLSPELQVDTLAVVEARWLGLDNSFAIDKGLSGIGHYLKKEVVSLESPALQFKALHFENPADTVNFVEESLTDLENDHSKAVMDKLSVAWETSQYEQMRHYEDWCQCLDTDLKRQFMKRVLDDRNPALADKIDALHMAGKQVFAAVGSLHMFGAAGLPTLMQKRGYKVEMAEFTVRELPTGVVAQPDGQ